MLVQWSDALRVGVHEIDTQHIGIFEVCSRLNERVTTGAPEPIAAELDFLSNYLDAHFAMEEKLMAEVQYGEMAQHQREHSLYRAALSGILAKAKVDRAAVRTLADSVTTWLLFHIMQEDRALAQHVASKRAG